MHYMVPAKNISAIILIGITATPVAQVIWVNVKVFYKADKSKEFESAFLIIVILIKKKITACIWICLWSREEGSTCYSRNEEGYKDSAQHINVFL